MHRELVQVDQNKLVTATASRRGTSCIARLRRPPHEECAMHRPQCLQRERGLRLHHGSDVRMAEAGLHDLGMRTQHSKTRYASSLTITKQSATDDEGLHEQIHSKSSGKRVGCTQRVRGERARVQGERARVQGQLRAGRHVPPVTPSCRARDAANGSAMVMNKGQLPCQYRDPDPKMHGACVGA